MDALSSDGIKHYQRTGQVERLTDNDKDSLMSALCKRYELDPIMRPFQLINFNGQQKFYMTASATNQIADQRDLSREITELSIDEDTMIAKITVKVSSKTRVENTTTYKSLAAFRQGQGGKVE